MKKVGRNDFIVIMMFISNPIFLSSLAFRWDIINILIRTAARKSSTFDKEVDLFSRIQFCQLTSKLKS